MPCKPLEPSQLHVISVISNPMRFASRYRLYREFDAHMRAAGVYHHTVELQFGDRPCEVTEPTLSNHVQLQSFEELWHKEAMINIGIAALPDDWEYVAWIDADVSFAHPNWAVETLHQLQHHMLVQLFSHAVDLGPHHEVLQSNAGFAYMYHQNGCNPPQGHGYTPAYGDPKRNIFWHPGFAWAARREAIDYLGQLIDFAILGSADHHMAMALIGQADRSIHKGTTRAYRDQIMDWQDRAERHIQRDIGYVDGALWHYWHGKKADRRYVDRWRILTENQFNPVTDLKRDWQYLWQLRVENPRQIRLRDAIRAYFRARSEDSIDV
jgi:hypothetical protein